MTTSPPISAGLICSDIPARLDRLPWSRFHWRVVTALGVTWILDGLEVTLVGSLAPAIAASPTLAFTPTQVGLTGSAYIAGAVIGALFFGRLTDRLGRKRLFTVTVAVYLVATVLTGLAWDFWSFVLFRFLTGAGIGGEYAAVNSAIQELTPARRRGVTDLIINGSFWIGAALGAAGALAVLNSDLVSAELGWRLAFIIGGLLAVIIIWLRRLLPESPRWLLTHGRAAEAEAIVAAIERATQQETGQRLSRAGLRRITLAPRTGLTLREQVRPLFVLYPRRATLATVLMATQAFCYNAVFFTYALILTTFYGIPAAEIGWFMLPFALGNFLGPLLLGRLFDTIGRKPMITATYAAAGVLTVVTGVLFQQEMLSAVGQTAAWTIIFFFASAGASAAYLTVGESFPLESRGMAIAVFYAFGTAVGGILGPWLFGALIAGGARSDIMFGYILGGALMLFAAAVEVRLGIAAERRPLEEIAPPLCAVPESGDGTHR
jgi:MFS family permease